MANLTPEQRRKYYLGRKQAALNFLGNKCVVCGETKGLEIHHIDPKTKSYNPLANYGYQKMYAELKKCELRCPTHHDEVSYKKKEHGTTNMYRGGCRCDPCIKANSAAVRNWRARNPLGFAQ